MSSTVDPYTLHTVTQASSFPNESLKKPGAHHVSAALAQMRSRAEQLAALDG